MEASLVTNHSMVPQVLEDRNYKTWRIFMEHYLLGQDLWDVVTQPEPDERTDIRKSGYESWENIIKSWRRNNALALHAIKMSCGPEFLPLVLELTSSKEAWDLLVSAAKSDQSKPEEDKGVQKKDVGDNIVVERVNENETDYDHPFIPALVRQNQLEMEMFIDHHPEALSARVFSKGDTGLHFAIRIKKKEAAMWLVERMTGDDLEILGEDGYTALARGAEREDYPGVLDLLQLMVKKNPRLPNIGGYDRIPVNVASSRGNENSVRFLYWVTDKSVLNPELGLGGVHLLILCINKKIYDIAADVVRLWPNLLLHQDLDGVNPIQAWAKTSRYDKKTGKSDERKPIDNHYHDFINLVCVMVSTFNKFHLKNIVHPAIIYATKHGNAKFINAMIRANPISLLAADDRGKSMFWHAVENRQEKIFRLIYKVDRFRDSLLASCDYDTGNTVFHLVALLPPPGVLDGISASPVLQLQREVLWFKELWSLADLSKKEALNKDGLTPRQLFSRSHADMIAAGERLIKETATSSTVVGALILTIMFAAAFTVPGGNNQETGYPIFADKILFELFIMCDVLSLSSSATSILVFLTILTNSYAEEDFLFDLPKRLMMGVLSLFFSIATMMVTFCIALALMLNGRLQLILPIAFITSAPVILFSKSMFPLLSKIFRSTFGSSIFDGNTKLPFDNRRKGGEKTMNQWMDIRIE